MTLPAQSSNCPRKAGARVGHRAATRQHDRAVARTASMFAANADNAIQPADRLHTAPCPG